MQEEDLVKPETHSLDHIPLQLVKLILSWSVVSRLRPPSFTDLFTLLNVGVLSAWMYVYHAHSRCSQRLEEDLGYP